jgi:NADH-quinone oxidoreductase subunit L
MASGVETPLLLAVPALPLAGFLVNALAGRRLPRGTPGILACAAMGLSAVFSLALTAVLFRPQVGGGPLTASLGTWISAGTLRVDFNLVLDPLSALMACVVTGVGFLIHVYSIGYMAKDDAQPRYFAYLNLFAAMMLVLVLSDNLALTFLGWEGVGLCSYLLIGFWFDDKAKAAAGLKAFLVNRIGDVGFLIGALALWKALGSLDYAALRSPAAAALPQGVLLVVCLGLFLGACGKSAQIPLYVWLPDAMAGPTPVSALIHAATMVTAGVYLLCRMSGVLLACPAAMTVVAVVGAATALWAAVIACAQTDIKKVLAYSTVSQLGFMVLACGVGAFAAAAFHLVTHAFFKACLFLGAGSVIHALGGEQDLRRMGGLRKALPWTHATFAVSVAALCGLPPLSGFFSKDAILWGALEAGQPAFWAVGLAGAALTAFYMTRLYALAFRSSDRVDPHAKAHLHESPRVMTAPLVILAILTLLGGLLNLPGHLAERIGFKPFLDKGLGLPAVAYHAPLIGEGWAMGAAVLAALGGVVFARTRYAPAGGMLPDGKGLAHEAFRVDALFDRVLVAPLKAGAGALWFWVDRVLVDGLMVEGPAFVARGLGLAARRAQSGYASASLATLLFGVLMLLWLLGGFR